MVTGSASPAISETGVQVRKQRIQGLRTTGYGSGEPDFSTFLVHSDGKEKYVHPLASRSPTLINGQPMQGGILPALAGETTGASHAPGNWMQQSSALASSLATYQPETARQDTKPFIRYGAKGLSSQEARQAEKNGINEYRAQRLKTTKNKRNAATFPGGHHEITIRQPRSQTGILSGGMKRSVLAETQQSTDIMSRPVPPNANAPHTLAGSFSLNDPLAATTTLSQAHRTIRKNETSVRKSRTEAESILVGNVPVHMLYAMGPNEAARMATLTRNHKRPSPIPAVPASNLPPDWDSFEDSPKHLGALAAKYESGEEGLAAIGYDRQGGTSYGTYQISSRSGTMNQFIRFLQEKAPDIGRRLATAGPANTGSRRGSMPAAWKKVAAEQPHRFEQLQSDFIKETHFAPALENVTQQTGIAAHQLPPAFHEVVFSTAVQHGAAGASRIIGRAANKIDLTPLRNPAKATAEAVYKAGKKLIEEIYAIRSGQFASSTRQVQIAAKNRLIQEKNEALSMFQG